MMRLKRSRDEHTDDVNAALDKNVKELEQVTQELKQVTAALAVKMKEFSHARKI